jgi:hypothetical protein
VTRDPLIRAWAALVVLGLGATLIAASPGLLPGPAAGALLLILAWAKARLILNAFLGLSAAPAWARGFGLALGLYMALLLGLALAA